ncbi:MAG TPA: FkbM family methyltransferase [Gallionellaceae bacterium]|nr:FkbM family methyltransferase [Gallionellaceae bacterium]
MGARLVVWLATLYRRMPVKPLNKWLARAYREYLNSGNGHSLVIKNIDGINYELDLREAIDYAMYVSGSREPETTRALKRLCKPGDVVFDIGANVGSHTLPIASYVGSDGKVYAFEPVPWAINRMSRNVELNTFANLVLEPIALSDVNEEKEMKFRVSFKIGSKSGVGKDGKIDGSWWDECEQVRVRLEKLDDYVASHEINRLDLIKLDVDGFEGKVIRGGLQTLKRFLPDIIMEVAPAWTEMRGDDVRDILKMLQTLGYAFYQEGDFRPIDNLSERIAALPSEGGFNILASVRKLEQG